MVAQRRVRRVDNLKQRTNLLGNLLCFTPELVHIDASRVAMKLPDCLFKRRLIDFPLGIHIEEVKQLIHGVVLHIYPQVAETILDSLILYLCRELFVREVTLLARVQLREQSQHFLDPHFALQSQCRALMHCFRFPQCLRIVHKNACYHIDETEQSKNTYTPMK